MRADKEKSITAEIVHALLSGKTGREVRALEAELLSQEILPIRDWIDGHAVIDRFYLVFLLATAARGLEAQLEDRERNMLQELRGRIGADVITVPVREEAEP